ncbi:MAG: MFS transporter [Actinobacteria bacterium]|nr:MFS transporter [Actinomycetota bacterium]
MPFIVGRRDATAEPRGRIRAATRETFQSLRTRNFRLFFGGQLISQVGNWQTLVAQTLLVLSLTNSGVALGILAAAQFGPVLLLGPFAGLIADRSDKRKLLLTVQVIAMVQSFALAGLAFTGRPPLLAIYAVATVGGITMAFDNPARRSFVVEMVPEGDVNNAVSLNSAMMTASRVVGPVLAGLLITTVGFGWAFAADGLSYVAVLVALSLMRPSELRRAPATPRGKGQVRDGLRYARRTADLWVPLVMMAIVGTFAYNFQVVFPLFVIRDLGGNEGTFTVLFSVVSVGALVGALAVARRRSIDVRTVSLSSLAFGVSLAAMAVAPSLAVAFPLGLLVGFGSIAFLTASTAIVQVRSAPEMRGRVLALQAMVFLGSTPIGGPIVGWISQDFGARYGVGVGAVAALGAGAWGLAAERRGRSAAMTSAEADMATDEALAELGGQSAPPDIATRVA